MSDRLLCVRDLSISFSQYGKGLKHFISTPIKSLSVEIKKGGNPCHSRSKRFREKSAGARHYGYTSPECNGKGGNLLQGKGA